LLTGLAGCDKNHHLEGGHEKNLWTIFIVSSLTIIGLARANQTSQAQPAKPSDQAKHAEPAKPAAPAPQIPGPSFKDVLSLESAGNPVISPDGKNILFTVSQADWDKNRYDTEIWLSRDGAAPFQLTQTTDESSDSPSWSPDGRWIAFLANRDGKTSQIYLMNSAGGEAFKLTDHKESVNSYEWCPSGKSIAFTSTEPESKESKGREKQYGKFQVEDAEYRMTHLWLVAVEPGKTPEAKRLTSGTDFTIGGFAWSPDGKKIAFAHRPDPLINSGPKSDISILEVETGKITPLVTQPGSDSNPCWSPDGQWIAFSTSMGDDRFYVNGKIAKIPAGGGPITVLSSTFDEDPYLDKWTKAGIGFMGFEKVFIRFYLLDPANGNIAKLASLPESFYDVSFADDGNSIAFAGFDRTTLTEIYRANLNSWKPQAITKMTEQVAGWKTGSREVIQWKSRDGTMIDGILWKPDGFETGKRYPLLVGIHGGPTGTSMPVLVDAYVYPYLEWLSKGVLILEPNYRGSAGYGEKFRSLNVRNLGVGDMWDVESGVDYLVAKGLADPERVGAMGWSQGGYISAFLATNSTKFKAISVGAGISNWVTYYVNTDIHPFTRHYLKATPWDDMAIYLKTSPMTNIKKARTPTLIQHGENDRRVPIPNAYELFQGLQDVGVPTKLIVYKGFGHGISKPKEQLVATWHNWQWFAKYIWGEDVVIPVEVEEEKAKDEEEKK
jgi:dipeptidyl aminopeptidase/acylaminoacyl peptidase